jgi:hypothetical protein
VPDSHADPLGPINPDPTQFPELNQLLTELTQRARDVLQDNFVGAYLEGSFAVGDADEYSDCDFLIPVNGPITADQEAGLRELHREFPHRSGHWCRDLEGAYPDRAQLKSLHGLDVPWLYVDRGHQAMEWSTHCNTDVVRWTLRERGIALVGPDPKTLVDPVPGAVLQETMRRLLPRLLEDLLEWTTFEIAWTQRYMVTAHCRMLHTLHTGEITSKRAALLWALNVLDEQWHPLLVQVMADREHQWDDKPRPGSVAATLQFARYVESFAAAG